MSEKASIYTRMIRAGRRTYFFDVREARNNKRFMIIAESTRSDDGTFNRSSVIVFPDDVENFLTAFSEARALLKDGVVTESPPL
ncbi:MAG: DUF3276 family protein [Nitrospirae bacterium]|nr:DUF3276 family protein [Nitrospirota bacterium]